MKRLSKSTGHWGASTILYSMDDHLLLEKRIGYSATYRRFFYDDIIAIIVYQKPSWRTMIKVVGILSICSLIFIGVLYIMKLQRLITIPLLILFSFLWVYSIIELILGPSAKTQIKTLTTVEDFMLAHRYTQSKKLAQKIQRLIEEKQGVVTMDSLVDASLNYQNSQILLKNFAEEEKKGREIPDSKYDRLYFFFLIALFFEVVVTSLQMRFHGQISILLGLYSGMVIILNAVVLFKQKGRYIRRSLQILSWTSLILLLSSIAEGLILGVIFALNYEFMGQYEMEKFIRHDPRYLIGRTLYLTMMSVLVAIGAIISLKGHHSVYTHS